MPTITRAPLARHLAAAAAAGALVLAPASVSSADDALTPPTTTEPSLLGAHYLEQRLIESEYLLSITFDDVDYAQYGLVADAILALDAAGTGQDAAAAATEVLSENVVNYVGFGDEEEIAAGAVAKLLNVAAAQGVDPTAFGTYDLVGALEGLEDADGRFRDVSAFGDYSNTFGQSFALIGLSRAGAGPSAKAVNFLEAQQCPGGGFQLGMDVTGCTDESLAQPDSTSMAVQALVATGGDKAVINDALDYLTGQQQASGGVGGSGPTSATNANSTGLAGQAFLAGGRSAQARLAVGYLTPLQYGCTFPAALRGGIAYDPATLATQKEAGEDAVPEDQDNRSTSQAILALAGTPLGTVTSRGAAAVAPEPDCAAANPSPSASATTTVIASPSTTPNPSASATSTVTASPSTTATPSASATPRSSTTASATPTSGSDPSASTTPPAAGGPTGPLAQTGSDLLLPVGLGVLLVVLGGAAVLSSRRRGAHS